MGTNNDITNDRIVNMKGDKKKYDEGYDRIFGKSKKAPKKGTEKGNGSE